MSAEELRRMALLDGLTDDQLQQLLSVSEVRAFGVGEELFVEGRPAETWFVLLDGTITLLRRVGQGETVLGAMDSLGQWAGGFRAWDEHGVYLATGRAVTTGRVLEVAAGDLRACAEDWFPLGVHLMQGLIHTARAIESGARRREALVALGTLAAGLAHEINNPASAATRAVDALEDASAHALLALTALAENNISAAQFTTLDRLRRELGPAPGAEQDPLGLADREEELTDVLTAAGVDDGWRLAGTLAGSGADPQWCRRAVEAFEPPSLGPALEWVAASLSTAALLSEVKAATQRISELVAAVRTYSQLDRGSVQTVEVREGIESTLTMLSHKLRDAGITVVRDYAPDVPPIEAFAGELNQVWTNLVDNAIDAMDGPGTLRISIRGTGTGVSVEVGDSGPGMTDDVQAHAFEPFFTTKEVGRGTGLGLDISRRVVTERHGGQISIDAGGDGTVVRVELPWRPAA